MVALVSLGMLVSLAMADTLDMDIQATVQVYQEACHHNEDIFHKCKVVMYSCVHLLTYLFYLYSF